MAARRLIIVLILLLAASVLAASIAPDRTSRLVGVDNSDDTSTEETTTSTSTTSTTTEETTSTAEDLPTPAPITEPAADQTGGVALTRRIDASEKKPETVVASVGDQLSLSVGSKPARTVSFEDLGLTEFAGDDAPARFDLLLRRPGTYELTDAGDPSIVLGTLEVNAPASGGKPQK